jgi:Ca2+-binding EF-hand superfamily protein
LYANRSGEGKLKLEDLHIALTSLALQLSSHQVLALVAFIDADGDGEVDIQEVSNSTGSFAKCTNNFLKALMLYIACQAN